MAGTTTVFPDLGEQNTYEYIFKTYGLTLPDPDEGGDLGPWTRALHWRYCSALGITRKVASEVLKICSSSYDVKSSMETYKQICRRAQDVHFFALEQPTVDAVGATELEKASKRGARSYCGHFSSRSKRALRYKECPRCSLGSLAYCRCITRDGRLGARRHCKKHRNEAFLPPSQELLRRTLERQDINDTFVEGLLPHVQKARAEADASRRREQQAKVDALKLKKGRGTAWRWKNERLCGHRNAYNVLMRAGECFWCRHRLETDVVYCGCITNILTLRQRHVCRVHRGRRKRVKTASANDDVSNEM